MERSRWVPIRAVFLDRSTKLIVVGSWLTARKTEKDSIALSNDHLVVVISSEGRLTSVFDKVAERELLSEGETAGFVIFEDTPLNWDAWDVGKPYREECNDVKRPTDRRLGLH